jgi:5-oxoprolinase (ATP-hydrolysing)
LLVARVAESIGFEQVSVSSCVAPLEGFVSRADTTVADAYLGPVIRGYVARLKGLLPEARIQLMTSSGGLIDAGQVMGKDTILSGPAGGVVGCARIARDAGVARCIGFDMGGTSTDVCRVEVQAETYEYEHETVKAGIRLKMPMLAVETVAAGGGSVCRFDGQMLRVGPESAGADPGPACYGRDGPLTVTDVNLYLGRIVSDAFPFRLDVSAVEHQLRALCEQANEATGSSLTPIELATGLVRIANERMASAIRRISAARGYDLREYTLVAFGGAGGQHACALAELLGMKRVLCSPFAGVLSAVGIAATSNQRIVERDVVIPLAENQAKHTNNVIDEMQREAHEALLQDGVAPDEVESPRCTADVRYAGQSSTITVPLGTFATMRDAFEARHRSFYGYIHEERDCEIRTLRVLICSRRQDTPLHAPQQDKRSRQESYDSTMPERAQPQATRMIVDGETHEVPCRQRRELTSEQTITGPAIVTEDTSTVVIDKGWKARVLPTGDLELVRVVSGGDVEQATHEADPVQLELFHNRFAAIAEQMGAILRRTALSTNVKERLDYSCALFDSDGELVANAPHIPVHLGGMSDCVKALRTDVQSFAPGDVYMTNDPYRGGSHLNDITVITPVYDETDEHPAYFVASRAHHAEIGGKRPGSMAPDAQCLDEEGIVIRAFRYVRKGRVREDELRKLLQGGRYPSRAVEDNVADINAQVAANQCGAAELLRLSASHGRDVVRTFMANIRSASGAKMRATLAGLEAGCFPFEDALDDGTTIRLALTLERGTARFDFTGTDPVHPGCFNANRAIVTSAMLYCLRCLMKDDIPLNGGMLAPIELVLSECFLNPPPHDDPKRCAAVGGGNVETSQRIVDVIFGALRLVAASQGTMNNVLIGSDDFGYYETICGGAGAGQGFDGADAVHTHMTNTRLTDAEVMESRYPMRLLRFEVRKDTGGSGRYHGGCGVTREIEFLAPLELSLLTQRRVLAPYGLSGGEPGDFGRNRLYFPSKKEWVELTGTCRCRIETGARLLIETPGGGGYGSA